MSENFKRIPAIPPSRILAVLAVVFGSPVAHGQAQPKDQAKHAQHAAATKAAGPSDPMTEQLRELQAKVARLEAALQRSQAAKSAQSSTAMGTMRQKDPSGAGMTGGGGMGMMEDMDMGAMGGGAAKSAGGMPMMDDDTAEMAAMGGGGMPMMDDDDMEMGMMGMAAMGKAKGMAGMAVPSALPGFPGASHIYHIGATGYFMNHGKHITLTPEQKSSLNAIKQKALLAAATAKRKIDEAEQELWTLTAMDEPETDAIEAKARAIEAIRTEQRLAFILSVGRAAQVLTDEQRAALIGTTADSPAEPAPAAKP